MTASTRHVAEPAASYIANSWDALQRIPVPSIPGKFVVTFVPDGPTAAPDTDEAFRLALADAVRRGRPRWLEILGSEGGVVTAGQMATLLGISRQAVDKRRRAGTLLGFRDTGREYLYPVWQVRDGGMLPGFERALATLREGDHPAKSQVIFFLSPRGRFHDRRALDLLREGNERDIAEVENAALGYLEQGSS